MKPMLIALAALAASHPALAGTNFNSGTGILVIPDVTVDGKSFFDSVTLRLDLSTGAFGIVSYTPKNIKVSDTPIQTFENSGVSVGLLGCYRSGTNQVTCYAQVTNSNNDATIAFAASDYYQYPVGHITTKLFDNLGTPYVGAISVFGKSSGDYIVGTVLQGVPVRVAYTFTNVDSHATSIAAFSPAFLYGPTAVAFVATFKNISF